MEIRRAKYEDVEEIERLLYQVHKVHSDKRPDLFVEGRKKYSADEIINLMADDNTPIFVCTEDDKVLGYAFIVYLMPASDSLVHIKTMYVDDLCVDNTVRHKGVGSFIFDFLERTAKAENCYNILLNVYDFNVNAKNFYLKQGMSPLKTYMEKILK